MAKYIAKNKSSILKRKDIHFEHVQHGKSGYIASFTVKKSIQTEDYTNINIASKMYNIIIFRHAV